MTIEYWLINGRGQLDSVHPSADSAIATKFKRLFYRTYTIRQVTCTNDSYCRIKSTHDHC